MSDLIDCMKQLHSLILRFSFNIIKGKNAAYFTLIFLKSILHLIHTVFLRFTVNITSIPPTTFKCDSKALEWTFLISSFKYLVLTYAPLDAIFKWTFYLISSLYLTWLCLLWNTTFELVLV